MREAPHLLAVDVRLVPDQPVDQAGPGGVPALVQPSLHRHADVHLGEAAQWRDGGQQRGRREQDPEQGQVACRAGAQIAQLEKGPGDGNLLLDRLGDNERGNRRRGETV